MTLYNIIFSTLWLQQASTGNPIDTKPTGPQPLVLLLFLLLVLPLFLLLIHNVQEIFPVVLNPFLHSVRMVCGLA